MSELQPPVLTPYYRDEQATLYHGSAYGIMLRMPAESVHCCVTSPPYWKLRKYHDVDAAAEIGGEQTIEEYVDNLTILFRAVRRVLRKDGVLWLNIGDSYSASGRGGNRKSAIFHGHGDREEMAGVRRTPPPGIKNKELCGIPWRVALALQADGWYLRQDVVWHKPSAMPAPVRDRCVSAHEYLFLLTKSPRYYFDHVAIQEPAAVGHRGSQFHTGKTGVTHQDASAKPRNGSASRNKRSVWTIATQPYKQKHFATFPPRLVEPCILAGTSEYGCCHDCGAPYRRITEKTAVRRHRPNDVTARHAAGGGVNACRNTVAGVTTQTLGWEKTCTCADDEYAHPLPKPCTVLDPFVGSGTTPMVARWLGRNAIGIDLSETYLRDHAIARLSTPRPKAKQPKKAKKTDKPHVPDAQGSDLRREDQPADGGNHQALQGA